MGNHIGPGEIHLGEGVPGNERRTEKQDHCLDDVGVDHRREPPGGGIDTGKEGKHGAGHEEVCFREEYLEYHGTGEQGTGCVYEDIGNQGESGEVIAGSPVESIFEEFRDRSDPGLQIEGYDDDTTDSEDDGGHPFVVGDGDAPEIGGPGKTN